MVVGVVPLARRIAAGDDAPCAAMRQPRRVHRVFAVPAARLARQVAFAVAEHAAVLPVRERAAAPDQGDGVACFGRQEILEV